MSTTPLHRATTETVIPGFYMTLREAAEKLGLAGRAGQERLRRLLVQREEAVGQPIMIRRRGTHRVRLLVTLPLLEEHCPELFARRVQLTEELRQEVERLEAQIGLIKRQNLRLAEEITKARTAHAASPATRTR